MSVSEDRPIRYCILIVEDDGMIRQRWSAALATAGYDTLEAADGRWAIDVIPGAVVQLMIAGERQTKMARRVEYDGDIVRKPFDADELIALVRARLGDTKQRAL